MIADRAEPKTLHPVFAVDSPSREVIRLMTADLIHINRFSQRTEPALAKSPERAASFIRHNMPFDRPGTLTDQQAFDVALEPEGAGARDVLLEGLLVHLHAIEVVRAVHYF